MQTVARRWSLWEKQVVAFCIAMAIVLPWQLLAIDDWPPDYSDKGIWHAEFLGRSFWLAEFRAVYWYLVTVQVLAILIAVLAWSRTTLALAIVLPLTWPWFVEVRWL
jgi:hypothetical protein